jgi:hypothetical protein
LGLLEAFAKLLIVSGAIALYWNYGRALAQWLSPILPDWLRGQLLVDWLGLFAVLALAYMLVWLIGRRRESGG